MKNSRIIPVTKDVEGIIERLASADINWSEFNTLLMYILEERITDISPSDIMSNYRRNRFITVATTNPQSLLEIDRLLYRLLPQNFTAVEISPVNPIGTNAVLTRLNSKVVLPTIRNMEITGDPSMALALECANRRKEFSTTKESHKIHLATSHRSLRLQNFSKHSNLTAHFKAFALASAARDIDGFNRFELISLSTHISIWIEFLTRSKSLGYYASDLSIEISDTRIVEKLISNNRISREEVVQKMRDKTFDIFSVCSVRLPTQITYARDIPINDLELETYIRELQFTELQIIEPLRQKYPFVNFFFNLAKCSGIGYYSGISYRLIARNSRNERHRLAGGGTCNWTQKLLSSRRERLVTSGFGTEIFSKLFVQ